LAPDGGAGTRRYGRFRGRGGIRALIGKYVTKDDKNSK
jgi:hypothetical protein